jgi:hypothetical protein
MAALLLSFIPIQLSASTFASVSPAQAAASEKANALAIRLGEIKAMDKSKLSASERKSLREEAHILKIKAKKANGGIYISVGALLIVILLLILLL